MNICSELHEQGILWFKGGNHKKAKECWVTKLLQQIQTNLYKYIQKYRFYETESPLYREIGANSVLIALNP